jgi:ssDNA-binding Zn-finger/Zn-ribbon topoisomerase 1
MPWEETDQFIRSGHRSPDDFQSDSLRTITISEEEGIKAVIGKPKGKDTTEVQSYLFAKDKDWTVDKAKAWFEQHKDQERVKLHEHMSIILPFKILEKIVDKPLKIRGVAMTAGMSRNFNIYTPEELQAFASKLVSAPVYIEHVAVPNAVGKVTKTEWDGENLWYEAEIYDEETAEKIRKGLVQHVSVGADYEAIDVVDGKIPHGLHDAELSLVAVPGIPETNVQIFESLQRAKEQQEFCVFCGKNPVEFWLGCCSECFEKLPIAESKRQELLQKQKTREQQGVDPLVAGEYILGFYQDPGLFLPEHFRTVWLDQPNGVLAVMSKSRQDPTKELCQAILFSKAKFDANSARDWLILHPSYVAPASVSASPNTPIGIENMKEEDLKKLVEEQVKAKLKEQMEVLKCPKCGQTFDYYQWQSNNWRCPNKDCGVEVVPPEPVLLQVRGQEQPKDVVARAKNHFNKTDVEWNALSEEEKQAYIKKLPPAGTKRTREAEWDTEYINNLPDDAFAYIAPGGEKDEQSKTVPRTLRNLPYKNAEGNLDADHVRNALARLDQTDISAEGKAEAKKNLCAAAKELDIASDVCGLTDQTEALRKELSETKTKLTETEGKLVEARKTIEKLKPPGGLVKDPPKTMPIEDTITVLEGLLPSPAVERSTMGMQRECQAIRSEILKLRERLRSGQGHN